MGSVPGKQHPNARISPNIVRTILQQFRRVTSIGSLPSEQSPRRNFEETPTEASQQDTKEYLNQRGT